MEKLKTATHGDGIDFENVSIEEAVAAGSPAAAPVARTQADLDKQYILPQHQTTGLQAIIGVTPTLNQPPKQAPQPTTAPAPVQEQQVETAPVKILDKDVQEARAEIDRIMTESKAKREAVEASMVAVKADSPPLEKDQQVKPVSVGGFSTETRDLEARLNQIDNTPESIAKREADIAAKEQKEKNGIPATPDVQANNTALETAQGEGSGNEQQKEVAPEKGFFARFFGKKENSESLSKGETISSDDLRMTFNMGSIKFDSLEKVERLRIEEITRKLQADPLVGESMNRLKDNPRVDAETKALLNEMIRVSPKYIGKGIEKGFDHTSVYGAQQELNRDWDEVKGLESDMNKILAGGTILSTGMIGYAAMAGITAAIPAITLVAPIVLALLAARGIYMANVYRKKQKGESILQKLFAKKA